MRKAIGITLLCIVGLYGCATGNIKSTSIKLAGDIEPRQEISIFFINKQSPNALDKITNFQEKRGAKYAVTTFLNYTDKNIIEALRKEAEKSKIDIVFHNTKDKSQPKKDIATFMLAPDAYRVAHRYQYKKYLYSSLDSATIVGHLYDETNEKVWISTFTVSAIGDERRLELLSKEIFARLRKDKIIDKQ